MDVSCLYQLGLSASQYTASSVPVPWLAESADLRVVQPRGALEHLFVPESQRIAGVTVAFLRDLVCSGSHSRVRSTHKHVWVERDTDNWSFSLRDLAADERQGHPF